MPTALELLYVIAPCVLSLPVLALAFPPASPPSDIPGIRAVTVKTVTPRRTFIILTLCALAVTHTLEAALLIVDLVFTPLRDKPGHSHSTWFITSAAVHALGGLCCYALAAILAEWRMRWGSRALVLLALVAFGFEVPTLVLSVLREMHSRESSFRTDTELTNSTR